MSEQRKYRSWTAQQKLEIVLAGDDREEHREARLTLSAPDRVASEGRYLQ